MAAVHHDAHRMQTVVSHASHAALRIAHMSLLHQGTHDMDISPVYSSLCECLLVLAKHFGEYLNVTDG